MAVPHPAPFFERGTNLTDRPRLLLLSHHFPPGQAAGARRWEKLSHFFDERGWGIDVVTLAPEDLAATDFTRLEALPEGIRVFGTRTGQHPFTRFAHHAWKTMRDLRSPRPNPSSGEAPQSGPTPPNPQWIKREDVAYAPLTLAGWLSSFHVILEFADESVWANNAGELARRIFDPTAHFAVASCGPPHMVHRAASSLSRDLDLPLIVDLRDPWSHVEFIQQGIASPLWYQIAGRFESAAFEQASLIVMNTPAARDAMRLAYPNHTQKLICVTNGFDEDVLPEPEPKSELDKVFTLAFAGSIYADRTPRKLFRAMRIVSDELRLTGSDLRIELMGYFDSDEINEMAQEEGVSDQVTLLPPSGVRDVAALLTRAEMLVNLPQEFDLAIPSKIYEYLVYPAWILALAEPHSATGQILEGTAAKVVRPDDVGEIARVIRDCFEANRTGIRPKPVAEEARLGRRYQAQILMDAIQHQILDKNRP